MNEDPWLVEKGWTSLGLFYGMQIKVDYDTYCMFKIEKWTPHTDQTNNFAGLSPIWSVDLCFWPCISSEDRPVVMRFWPSNLILFQKDLFE